jgi:hypothetical protein
MNRVGLLGLIRIDFPGHTLRLSSGGFLRIPGDGSSLSGLYQAKDPLFGTIGDISQLNEGVGEQVPVLDLTLLPPITTAPAHLSRPGYQASPVKLMLAEFDPDTGLAVGDPDLLFAGQVDQTKIVFGKPRQLKMSIVSTHARLLERNIGNSLNPSWHKSIWPGETGHDQATGLGRNRAWGVEAPAPAPALSGGYAGGGARGSMAAL